MTLDDPQAKEDKQLSAEDALRLAPPHACYIAGYYNGNGGAFHPIHYSGEAIFVISDRHWGVQTLQYVNDVTIGGYTYHKYRVAGYDILFYFEKTNGNYAYIYRGSSSTQATYFGDARRVES